MNVQRLKNEICFSSKVDQSMIAVIVMELWIKLLGFLFLFCVVDEVRCGYLTLCSSMVDSKLNRVYVNKLNTKIKFGKRCLMMIPIQTFKSLFSGNQETNPHYSRALEAVYDMQNLGISLHFFAITPKITSSAIQSICEYIEKTTEKTIEPSENFLNIEGAKCHAEDFVVNEQPLKRLKDEKLSNFIQYLNTKVAVSSH